jgi:hypothetical protein
MRQAIDGGQKLRLDLWHPLRSPVWHPSMEVTEIELQLRRVWNDVLTTHGPLDSHDWYVVEISKVLQVIGHTPASHNGVVSFLEKPTDRERADKFIIPVVDLSQDDSLA